MTMAMAAATAPTHCGAEKNKRIFATRIEAEEFEKQHREKWNHARQYVYECPHDDHFHLSSSQSRVEGAPQLKQTDWSQAKAAWQVVEPEPRTTRGDKIIAALKRYKGSKTVKEIAAECGVPDNQIKIIYDIANRHDLPYLMKRAYGRMATPSPVVTLQNVQSRREQLEAELKRLDEQEKEMLRREEEKRRVTVTITTHENMPMIFVGANGGGLWVTDSQANSLLTQLPCVIETLSRQEAAAVAAGEQ